MRIRIGTGRSALLENAHYLSVLLENYLSLLSAFYFVAEVLPGYLSAICISRGYDRGFRGKYLQWLRGVYA